MIHSGDHLSLSVLVLDGDTLIMVGVILIMVITIHIMTGTIPGVTRIIIIREATIADTMMDITMAIGMVITDIHMILIHTSPIMVEET